MYVPATPAQAPSALSPVGIVSAAQVSIEAPVETALKVRAPRLNLLQGSSSTISGSLLEDRHAGQAGRLVRLQALGRHGWRTLASSRTRAEGRFGIRYVPRSLGSALVRVAFGGEAPLRASGTRLGDLNVYRLAEASWYGGGGNLACGGWLTSDTLGVANKTLPCGTLVTLHYGGRTVRVPVVDRGPFVAGREFDLTEATKRALGFEGVGQVWSTS